MKTQVVRAGKYVSVGIIIVSSLPVLLPLLFLLCVFGFVFVVPLGCTLVGFLYLRKYADMLYRKLPAARSRLKGNPSAGHVHVAGHVDITDPTPRDSQALQTYEELDQEFDAIIVSIVPPPVHTPADRIAENRVGSEALLVSSTVGEEARSKKSSHTEKLEDISWEGSETENLVGDASGSSDSLFLVAELGEAQLDNKSVQSSKEKANDSSTFGCTSAEDADEGEYQDADSSGGADSAGDVSPDFCIIEEKGLEDISSARDFDKVVENTPNASEAGTGGEIQIPQEKNNIQVLGEGKIPSRAVENLNDTNATVVDQGIQECYETPSRTETEGEGEDDADQLPGIAVDGTAEKEFKDGPEDGADQLPDIIVDCPAEQMVEDRIEDGADQLPDIVLDGRTETLGEVRTDDGAEQLPDITVDGSAEQMVEDRMGDGADQLPNIVVDGTAEKMAGGRKEDVADELPDGTSEEASKDRMDVEVDALSNDVTVKEARPECERHDASPVRAKPDVDSKDASLHTAKELVDHGLPLGSKVRLAGHENRDGNMQAPPIDSTLEKVNEDEEWGSERVSSFGVVKGPDSPSKLPVGGGLGKAQSEKCLRSGVLLPHQAHEDDVWICKECGWRYPNAKPSAKIRRNHKKNCKGRGSPTSHLKSELQRDLSSECHVPTGINKQNAESETSEKLLGNSSPKRYSGASQSKDESTLTTEIDQYSSSVAVIGDEGLSGRTATGAITSKQGLYPQSEAAEAESSRHLLVSSPATNFSDQNVPDQRPVSEPLAVDTVATIAGAASSGRYQDAATETASQSFRSMGSESFRSAQEAFFDDGDPCSFSSVHSETVKWDDDHHQHAQVQIERQLRSELQSMKEIVGDQRASAGELLLTEILELSDFLGIDLPAKDAELPSLEWARVAVEVMKIVVGVD